MCMCACMCMYVLVDKYHIHVFAIAVIITILCCYRLCYMSYKNGKFKERRNTTGQAANNHYDGSPHDISRAPVAMNACYLHHKGSSAFQGDVMEEVYEAVSTK